MSHGDKTKVSVQTVTVSLCSCPISRVFPWCYHLFYFFRVFDRFFWEQGQFSNPETPGYVGFANLPNQVHRKSVKKGFEFTLMVVGKYDVLFL